MQSKQSKDCQSLVNLRATVLLSIPVLQSCSPTRPPSPNDMAPHPKKTKVSGRLLLTEEVEINDSKKPGFKQNEAAQHYDVDPGTISTILKSQDKILAVHGTAHFTSKSKMKNLSRGRMPDGEEILYQWLLIKWANASHQRQEDCAEISWRHRI